MATFQITSSAGVDMGTYDAATAAEALDALARDAGYTSQAAAPVAFDGTVVEVETPHPCESGEATGERCRDEATTLVEWMPPHLRESHRAAGNSGVWPANGALRIRCCVTCAIELAEDGGREVGS